MIFEYTTNKYYALRRVSEVFLLKDLPDLDRTDSVIESLYLIVLVVALLISSIEFKYELVLYIQAIQLLFKDLNL